MNDDIFILDENVNIFEDKKLNELIIKSLDYDEKSIQEGIFYVNKYKYCYVDSNWHAFDNIWTICNDRLYDMITNYIEKYSTVKKYIKEKCITSVLNNQYMKK